MQTVREEWLAFILAVLPTDAPTVQMTEMRRAFYAGCWSMLQTLKGLGQEGIDEEYVVAVMEAMEAELKDFKRQVAEGRA